MPDISRKSIGQLHDELGTTLIKCFMCQEKADDPDPTVALVNLRSAQKLNKRRNELIAAIDAFHKDTENSPTGKTY